MVQEHPGCFVFRVLRVQHVGYSLNSSTGDVVGGLIGQYYMIERDSRSLNYSACSVVLELAHQLQHARNGLMLVRL